MNLNKQSIVQNAHSSEICALSFNPANGKLLASAGNDRYIKLWNLNEPNRVNILAEYKLHLYGVNVINWNKEGTLLCSGGNDMNINILDLNEQKLNRNFRVESPVTSVDFNQSSNLVLAGTYDNQILLFDTRSKNLVTQILAHSEPITSVRFSADSTVFLSTSYDGFCRLWDTFKGICLKTIVLEKSPPISKAVFLEDNIHCLISTQNSSIQVTNMYKEEEVIKYQGHVNSKYLLDFDTFEIDEEVYIISGSEDGFIYYWNVDGQNSNRFKLEDDGITMNCLSVGNNLIASSGFRENSNNSSTIHIMSTI